MSLKIHSKILLEEIYHAIAYDSPIVLDSQPVAADVVGVSAAAPVAEVKIRKEFPETWIWDMTDDNGCDI